MKKFLSILMLVCLLLGMVLPVAAEGEPSPLYAQEGDNTEFQTSLTFEAGQSLSARFYTGNTAGSSVITATEGFTTQEGLPIGAPDENGNRSLSASTAGSYTLSYELGEMTYSMTVTVTPAAPPPPTKASTVTVSDITVFEEALTSQEKFDAFLNDNLYDGSDPLTLVLPTGNLGSITLGYVPSNGASVVLKGVSGTTLTNLNIKTPGVSVDGITFNGSPAITASESCNVSNCKFTSSGDAFQLLHGKKLTLSGNTYSKAGSFAMKIISSGGKEAWNINAPDVVGVVDSNVFQVTTVPLEKATEYNLGSGVMSLLDNGWVVKYTADWPYSKCYVVKDGTAIASVTETTKNGIPFNVTGQKYYVVEGTLPTIRKVDNSAKVVEIDKLQSTYLQKVSLVCGFAAAKVTDSTGTTVYSYLDSNGKLTFHVKASTAEKYTITEISTTETVTKTTTKATTKTTSRSYKYTYQDYYLVTPAGFANGMRYVKDNLVTLDCSQAAKKPISLPVASMAEAAEKGYSLLVKTKDAELTLDAAALKSLAQQARGTTVLLRYQSLNHKTLTAVGQASLKSHLSQFPGDSADLAFLVTATSDSETIEDLQKGTVTLKIPFIVLPGTEEMENRVYALQSESLSEARETAVADGYLTTTLLDLTEHMVFQVGEPVETTGETTEATVETTVETTEETTQPETEPETTAPAEPVETAKKGGGLIIGLSVVLVILCGVVGFVFLRKRFRK